VEDVGSNPAVPSTYQWPRPGLKRGSTFLSNRGVERHLYDFYRAGHKNESGFFPIAKNDDFARCSNLVVMLVIGLGAANYIKLVSQRYVLDYKVSFRDQFLRGTDRRNLDGGNSLNRARIGSKQLESHEVLATGLQEGMGLAIDHANQRAFTTELGGNVRVAPLEANAEFTTIA
jgi:hypothetical protein